MAENVTQSNNDVQQIVASFLHNPAPAADPALPRASDRTGCKTSLARAPPDMFQAWMNHVLRMTDNSNVGQSIVNPAQVAPLERDHFFEIQTFIQFLWDDYENTWQTLPIGHYVDLASMISDERNVFRIERATNQAKKRIAIDDYPNDVLIRQYLGYTIQGYGGTVQNSLQRLVYDMQHRNTAYPWLTQAFGNEIAQIMGW